MITALKIILIVVLVLAGIAFAWALAELAVETIKEKYDGDKSNR